MDLCAQVYVVVASPRHEHSLSRKNEKMSNAEAATAAAPEVESDLSVLEAINELRAEEHFIDIQVEVCEMLRY